MVVISERLGEDGSDIVFEFRRLSDLHNSMILLFFSAVFPQLAVGIRKCDITQFTAGARLRGWSDGHVVRGSRHFDRVALEQFPNPTVDDRHTVKSRVGVLA